MSDYHNARHELRTMIDSQLRQAVGANGQPEIPEFNEMIALKTDQLLDAFERLANDHSRASFWRGVLQSLLGSLLVLILIALGALVTYGSKQNPFRILIEDSPPHDTTNAGPKSKTE